MTNHKVYFRDSRRMREVADSSVHLVVTSPPYWCIKDYGHKGQIGYDQSYEEYLGDIEAVISEMHRVLHSGCRAAINIGDQYLRAAEHGRYRVASIPSEIIVRAESMGFDYMGSILWEKISNTKTTGGCAWMGSMYYPKDGHVTYEHEYIVLFRKRGKWPVPTMGQKERSRLTKQERQEWFRGVWRLSPERQNGHQAMFPVELARRLVKMYSFHGETVLDPFLGSGTTSQAAKETGRNSIGFEIDISNKEQIERRLTEVSLLDAEERHEVVFG